MYKTYYDMNIVDIILLVSFIQYRFKGLLVCLYLRAIFRKYEISLPSTLAFGLKVNDNYCELNLLYHTMRVPCYLRTLVQVNSSADQKI